MAATYAVLFKTHFWDEFTRRQFERLKAQVGRGDLYVVVDETIQAAPSIPEAQVISVTRDDLTSLRLAAFTTHGSVLWYNTDYAQYVALSKLPCYDYYVAAEYDVALHMSLDILIDRLDTDGVEYLSFPNRKPADQWPWFPMHRAIYGSDMLVHLACFSITSHAALDKLFTRRQVMAQEFADGVLGFWPNNEAFLPNEIKAAGMRMALLSDYGSTELYDWWPPMHEDDLPMAAEQTFVHPVLQGTRYVRSLIHHEPSFGNLFKRSSLLRRKLARCEQKEVRTILREEKRRRLMAYLMRKIEWLGIRRRWYADAKQNTLRSRQRPSGHNAA